MTQQLIFICFLKQYESLLTNHHDNSMKMTFLNSCYHVSHVGRNVITYVCTICLILFPGQLANKNVKMWIHRKKEEKKERKSLKVFKDLKAYLFDSNFNFGLN